VSFLGSVYVIYCYVLFIVTAAMLDDWKDHQTQLGSMEKILEKNYDHQQQVMAKAHIWALAR
jgi:hypothetical protein